MRIHDATEQAYKRGYEDGWADATDPRPCLADGKPATFHRWVDEDKALLRIDRFLRPEDQLMIFRRFQESGVVDAGAEIVKVRTCSALVEYPDGSVGKVKPELITFLDRKEG